MLFGENMNYPENIEEIRKFAEEIGIDVCYLLGEKYKGDLSLPSVKSLPDNIVFNIGGYLEISNIKHIPSGTVFNVGKWLYMRFSTSISKDVVFNVGKWLWLYSVENISSDVKFNVGGEVAIRKFPYSGLSNCVFFDDPPTEDNPYDPLKNYSPKPKVKIDWC
jgi:hypothetical protein